MFCACWCVRERGRRETHAGPVTRCTPGLRHLSDVQVWPPVPMHTLGRPVDKGMTSGRDAGGSSGAVEMCDGDIRCRSAKSENVSHRRPARALPFLGLPCPRQLPAPRGSRPPVSFEQLATRAHDTPIPSERPRAQHGGARLAALRCVKPWSELK